MFCALVLLNYYKLSLDKLMLSDALWFQRVPFTASAFGYIRPTAHWTDSLLDDRDAQRQLGTAGQLRRPFLFAMPRAQFCKQLPQVCMKHQRCLVCVNPSCTLAPFSVLRLCREWIVRTSSGFAKYLSLPVCCCFQVCLVR